MKRYRTLDGILGIHEDSDRHLIAQTRRYLDRCPDATLSDIARILGVTLHEAGGYALAATE